MPYYQKSICIIFNIKEPTFKSEEFIMNRERE